MNAEKKKEIRLYVRDVLSQVIESTVDNIFSDNYIRDKVWDSLPKNLSEDPEVEHGLLHADESGSIDNEPVEKLIDELTNSFMERFDK
jgi:hypothetical protein